MLSFPGLHYLDVVSELVEQRGDWLSFFIQASNTRSPFGYTPKVPVASHLSLSSIELLVRALTSSDCGLLSPLRSHFTIDLQYFNELLSLKITVPTSPFVAERIVRERPIFEILDLANAPYACRSGLDSFLSFGSLLKKIRVLTRTASTEVVANSSREVSAAVVDGWRTMRAGQESLTSFLPSTSEAFSPQALAQLRTRVDKRVRECDDFVDTLELGAQYFSRAYRKHLNGVLEDMRTVGNMCPICYQPLGVDYVHHHVLSREVRQSMNVEAHRSASGLVTGGATPHVVLREFLTSFPGCSACNRENGERRVTLAAFGTRQEGVVLDLLRLRFFQITNGLGML